jgi:hypothetical protein
MSFSYPNFSVNYNITDEELLQLYNSINTWASEIKFLLESRTVTEIGRPQSGYVAYSASSGKFKGYVNNAWVDFH